jgi:hypothetical protein
MRPETVRNVMLGAALGIACLGCLCAGGFGLFKFFYVSKLARLNDNVYKVIQEPAGKDESGGPYLKGKVVLVDRNKRELDGLHRAMPEAMRAEGLNEIGTVIWLEWDHKWVRGGRAPVCKVTVIDRARNVIVGENTFEGEPPPMPNLIDRFPTEVRPNAEITGWIKSLPRR